MATVQVQGVAKSYQPGVPVLKPLDLTVQSGELFFLLGSSGCGKSTLLRILAGLVEPDAGTIRLDGCDITRLPPEKRRATMVFQNYALWPHLTVFQNVAFGLQAAGAGKAEIRDKVGQALELVQLADYAARNVPSLSGGQQQRVALARALAVDPALLLLDEPLSNLDARLRDQMRREIRRICKLRNLTAIYVTHDRQEALSMADRLALMHEGAIEQTGTPEEVYHQPATRFVAGFLGDVNLLRGVIGPDGALRTALGEFPLRCPDPLSSVHGAEVTAAVRPERIRFAEQEHAGTFRARLVGRTFLGEKCEWRFEAAGMELLVTESAPSARVVGDVCLLAFEPGHLVRLRD